MKSAARSPAKVGTVQEDAPGLEHTGVQACLVPEDAIRLRLRVVLEALGCKRRRQRRDQHRLVGVTELGADRAAALAEMLGGLIEDAETAPAPDACPVRFEEVAIESPDDLAGVDPLERRAHTTPDRPGGSSASRVRS